MPLGALLDLGVEVAALRTGFDRLAVGGFKLRIAPDRQSGIVGTRVEVVVTADTASPARDLQAVRDLIGRRVEAFGLRVFERLAAAEAKVHGIPIEAVHFHEVGLSTP